MTLHVFAQSTLARISFVLLVLSALARQPSTQTFLRAARLQGSQVVPPVPTSATGAASITLNTATNMVTINGTFSGLSSAAMIVALHGPAPIGVGAGAILMLSFSGTTSGTFSGTGPLTPAQTQDLLDGLHYVDIHSTLWPDSEIRGQVTFLASVATRNAGTNPASYVSAAPLLGANWTATVDLTTSGHTSAFIVGFMSPANVVLSGGQRLLVSGAQVFQLAASPGPIASFSGLIPDTTALYRRIVYTQAVHFGGVAPFKLSNAQDLTLGL